MNAVGSLDLRFDAVADLVRARTGLVFPPARRTDVEAGARKVMAKFGVASISDFLCRLQDTTSLLDELIAELTVGETYFFRDANHFAFIRDEVIPEIRKLRGPEHVLRAWSAGCASGEEAYSLAILFDEAGLANRARILATDISRTALARAREANYGGWSLRGEGARLIGQHLNRSGSRFQLVERLRRRVEFAYLNLAQDVYPTVATNTWGLDLVLCRNVLIYLDHPTTRRVAQRLHNSLAAGGFLVVGPSDPLLSDHAPFETLTTTAGVIYRKPAASSQHVSVPAGLPAIAQATTEPLSILPLGPCSSSNVIAVPSLPERHDPIAEAREAFARGDNDRVIDLTGHLTEDAQAMALCIRALANLGASERALVIAAEAATRHPTSLELGFLHAVFLMNEDRHVEAEQALKRTLYIDRSLAVAHFALGATLHRRGDRAGALRAFRNAQALALRHPSTEILAMSDGERADRFAQAAAAQVAILESGPESG